MRNHEPEYGNLLICIDAVMIFSPKIWISLLAFAEICASKQNWGQKKEFGVKPGNTPSILYYYPIKPRRIDTYYFYIPSFFSYGSIIPGKTFFKSQS
jgi:hypothetical protein